ncbi:hypothetical protein GCM10012275_39340 [Longimycelium tulufanense]|uniref:Uncharacterized protein n=1 Tax=Longimycelium tulufanense TaxID=907463 RepID=A0A8J3CAC3_9PSEU|nr:hypothetical protein GCM10012275_39340 [Longimycelium tulufanense]
MLVRRLTTIFVSITALLTVFAGTSYATERATCSPWGDFLRIYQGMPQWHECYADAGDLEVHIPNATFMTSGDNAGFIRYVYRGRTVRLNFGKHEEHRLANPNEARVIFIHIN